MKKMPDDRRKNIRSIVGTLNCILIIGALTGCRESVEEIQTSAETTLTAPIEVTVTAAPVTVTAASEGISDETTTTQTETEIITTTVTEETEEVVEKVTIQRQEVDISEYKEYNKNDLFHFGLTPIYRVDEDRYVIEYALMNDKGELATDFIYFQICGFSENGIAAYMEKNKWGLCDVNGNVIAEPQYTDIGIDFTGVFCTEFPYGLLSVKDSSDHWGFINEKGELVVECKYSMPDDAKPEFVNGYAVVYLDNFHAGYIDTDGELLCTFKYTYADDFNKNGYAVVGIGEEGQQKFGVIDKKGNEVIPCEYDIALPFSDDGLAVTANYPDNPQKPLSEFTLFKMNEDGNAEIVKDIDVNWRNKLEISSGDKDMIRSRLAENGMMVFVRNNYYGIMDYEGRVLIEPQYQEIYDISPDELPENVICVLERFDRRYTLNNDGEISEYVRSVMDDSDPKQQIMLELNGFEPRYTGNRGEKKLSSIYKDGELYADLSDLDTPKAMLTADGYLYIVGYKESNGGGYTTIHRIITPDGNDLEIPSRTTLAYNYVWGGY